MHGARRVLKRKWLQWAARRSDQRSRPEAELSRKVTVTVVSQHSLQTQRRHVRSLLLIVLTLVVGVTAGGCSRLGRPGLESYLNRHGAEVDQAASINSRSIRFIIEPGTPARAIGQNLQRFGLIGDATLFEAYVRVNGLDDAIQAGTYVLDPTMTLRQIVEAIQHAEAASVTITIPEGWRLEQTADYLTQANILAEEGGGAVYRQQAETGELGLDMSSYPFLLVRPQGAGLEGYLFPDTYEIPKEGATAVDVLTRQLDAFAERVAPLYDEAVKTGATDLSLCAVLTLASIVEREAVVPEERPAIAGVYLNRLENGIKLDADPTVQYAIGYQPATGQWWKTPVSLEEYASAASPYNTYLNPGLPPGPIAAPGLSSIRAVLDPAPHDYLYFVAIPDGTGRHVFAETYEEHLQNVAAYMGGG